MDGTSFSRAIQVSGDFRGMVVMLGLLLLAAWGEAWARRKTGK